MRYNLIPYITNTKWTTNLSEDKHFWVFEVRPMSQVKRAVIAKNLITLYPDLKIYKISVIKTIKRNKVVVTCSKKAPWIKS